MLFPDQDDGLSSDGSSDGDPRRHGGRGPAGPAGDPLPERRQRRRRGGSLPVQPAGPPRLGRVRGRRLQGGVRRPRGPPPETSASHVQSEGSLGNLK